MPSESIQLSFSVFAWTCPATQTFNEGAARCKRAQFGLQGLRTEAIGCAPKTLYKREGTHATCRGGPIRILR
ncbi:hypothetical protein CYMTET_48413 [Cymbomonas tetramitiformis]|uniref:Uncharacterized protein n=1 Tax=Cymbomonas tetramitiformis TaxID=36881 RepID=A0AAE0BTD2_9CHLO|nr:hypothetical protein CYMTET_48413 [Cymbomonas tetramitiformis]